MTYRNEFSASGTVRVIPNPGEPSYVVIGVNPDGSLILTAGSGPPAGGYLDIQTNNGSGGFGAYTITALAAALIATGYLAPNPNYGGI